MNTRKTFILSLIFYFFSNALVAQIILEITHTSTDGNGYSCVPVIVENFNDVIGFQFSLAWNPDELIFDNINNLAFPNINFNTNQTDDGMLAILWDEPTLNGQSLPNDAVLFEICINANGNPEDVFAINFSDIPTPCTFVQYDGMNLIESVADKTNGTITVGSPLAISNSIITNAPCFGTNTASINVEATGGTPPYSFNWNPMQLDTNFIENISAGNYELTITDNFGDSITTTFEVTQPESSVNIEEILLPNLTCEMLSGTIEIMAAGGTSPYTYQFNGMENATGIFENIAVGDYLLNIVDANQCELEDTIQIPIPVSPNAFLLGDTISCDEPITLTTNNGNFSYEWLLNGNSLNLNQNVIEVTQSGIYQIELTNENACTDTASIEILFAPSIDVNINANAFEICPNETVELTPQGGEMYSWIGQNLTIDMNQTATFSSKESGLYIFDLVATDEYNCNTDTASIEILVFEPLGTIARDTCIAINGTAELMAFNGVNYEWANNLFPVSRSDISNPTASPTNTTTYSVTIEDENGCIVTDSIQVEVIGNPIDFVEAINVITPNGDGENDFLEFKNLEKFPLNRLIVFNRWGAEVYSNIKYQNDWGGTYNGNKLPTGDYYYVLSVGKQQLKSALTILNDE